MKVRVSACLPVICTVLAFAVQLKATPLQQIQQELQGNNFQAMVEQDDQLLESQAKQESSLADAERSCKEENEKLKGQINVLKESFHLLLCDKKDKCAIGAHNCDPNADCTSTHSDYICTCRRGFQGDGYTCSRIIYRDCKDAYDQGVTQSGVYTINPIAMCTTPFNVYCDMNTDGGGWIVFQRRKSNNVTFARPFAEYEESFGNPEENFWLGLMNIRCLTVSAGSELRIDMTAAGDETAYAKYSVFGIGDQGSNYELSKSDYSGTAGDGLIDGSQFSTFDRDNDKTSAYHCSAQYGRGGWWYDTCAIHASLNGEYLTPGTSSWNGILWHSWKTTYSLKYTEMKLRRK